MTDDQDACSVPLELLEGFARTWVDLQGGSYRNIPISNGIIVHWTAADGESEALPERMYGVAGVRGDRIDPAEVPSFPINLPPGVGADGAELVCETHILRVASIKEAWDSLKRVGRQGVRKAEKMGCRAESMDDATYLDLCRRKNERLGSPAPHPELLRTLREHFGEDNVGVQGVYAGLDAAAAVLWVVAAGYAMLVDGSSESAHWDKNPNNLAVWSALEALIGRGVHTVDYGFSPVGAGDRVFKKHMGGQRIPLYRLD